MSHRQNHFLWFAKEIFRTLTVIFLVVLALSVAKGQQTTTSVTDGSTPSGLQPGSPAGSYALSGFDNVNLYNGNLNFHLPLLQISGRGSAQMTSVMALNVKGWHVSHFHRVMPDGNEIDSYKPSQLGWAPYNGLGAGTVIGRNYGLMTSSNLTCTWYSKTLSRITFSMPGGTELELRDQDTNGQPLTSLCNQGANRKKVFVTADGTAATFISDTDIIDSTAINLVGPHGFTVSGYLMLRDGTRYRIDNSNVTWIRDRNGNMLRFAYTSNSMTITDSLNRTVTVNYNVSDAPPYGLCDQIIYTGFGGGQHIIRVSHTSLQNVLRSGYTIKTLGNAGGLFPELTGGSPGNTYNPTDMTSAVWLPDGRSYKFYYNSYGELARVELPTGGAVEYDMTPGSGVVCYGGCADPSADRQIYRRVVERRVYPNGSSGNNYELKDVYTNSETVGTNSSTVTVEETASNGTNSTVISRHRHYFDGSALNSFFTGGSSGYGPWYEGHEKQTDQLDTAGAIETATALRRVVNTWAQQSHISWWTGYGPQSEEAPNNPRLIETVTTIEPSGANLVSKTTSIDPNDATGQTLGFDQFNNPTDVWEYDYANTFFRRAHTDYVTSSSYINANVDPALGAHLRSLPSQRWISSDISGANKVYLTQYEYDVYSDNARHKPLTNRSGITGLCLTLDAAGTCIKLSDPSYTIRGNVTGTTGYTDASAATGQVTLSTQYDIAGNVTAQLDPLGNQATLSYADSFCNGSTCGGTFTANTYAFPTSTTTPIPDPTGQHGSATAFTSNIVYDYSTGRVTSTTDANSETINIQYNDILDRITAIIRPTGGGRTDYEYGDTIGNLFLRTRTDLDASRKIDAYQYFDGLGRATETRLYETGSQYIATKQIPFTIVQDPDTGTWLSASQTSNPYRPTLHEDPAWTTAFFDGLGRTIKVRTQDNAIVRTSFSGNSVTVTDQSGKQRRSFVDGAGRLVRTDEPDKDTGDLGPVATPLQATYYDYDVLGNLLHVTQGTQPQRSFSYNSLSRLTSAFNPESGTVSYQYDAVGNLTQKTDARSITIFYAYDNLNRSISVNYSNTTIGNPDSPDIEFFYDGAIKGKGRLWKSYAGGNETAGSNVDRTTIDQYDTLGRPIVQSQRFKLNGTWSSKSYQILRAFDLGGSVTTLNYPSGHSVTYNYDDAGRLGDNGQNLAFTGNLGDGAPRTYSRELIYTPAGQLTQEQFGTNATVYNKLAYNLRLQLAEIRASTTTGDTWNRGKILNQFSMQCVNAGAACNATDNNGNLRKQEVYIPADDQASTSTSWSQQYDYDQLNRLKRVHEYTGNSALDWQQEFDYDRWGNRTINASNTWIGSSTNPPSALLNETQFDTGNLATTNRLYAPGDLALPDNERRMRYDAAGNLIFDGYTGAGDRVYDADNHMTQAWGGNNQWQYYTYNAGGERTRRKLDNQETWQIYGFNGELLAEYPADGAQPQKEYGYRSGQLLVVAENSSLNGAPPTLLTATPPTGSTNLTLNWTAAQGAVKYRVERKDANTSYTSIGTTTSTSMTDNGTVSGTAYLYRVCSADAVGNCTSNYSNIALGAAITFTDPTIISTTDDPTGATAIPIRSVHITQLRTAVNAVRTLAGMPNATWTWNAAINDLIHVEDIRALRTELGAALTALQIDQTTPYTDPILVGFAENPATATPIKADHIRQLRQRATSGTGAASGSGATFSLNWLITDQLSTPRIVIDLSGTLNTTKRFDYLPFGETLNSSNGLRSTTNGYTASSADHIRQKFTQYERDGETGLDFAEARYYSGSQGRYTRPDPYNIFFEMKAGKNAQQRAQILRSYISEPKNWNRYSYVLNDPLNLIDPSGLVWLTKDDQTFIWIDDAVYAQHPDDYKGYSVANGAETQYQQSSNCSQCEWLKKGQWVRLNEDGSIDPIGDPTLNGNVYEHPNDEAQIAGFNTGMQWTRFKTQLPDFSPAYINAEIDIPSEFVHAGPAVTVTLDRNGNFYVGGGVWGGSPGASASIGWLLPNTPPEDVESFCSGLSEGVTAISPYYVGGGVTHSSGGTSPSISVGTPGVTGSVTYSKKVKKFKPLW
jgi:RHS repeat-associated protein